MFGRGRDDLLSGSKALCPACKIVLWHQEKHPRELKWAKFMACCHCATIGAGCQGIARPPEGMWLLQPSHPLTAGQRWLRGTADPLPWPW